MYVFDWQPDGKYLQNCQKQTSEGDWLLQKKNNFWFCTIGLPKDIVRCMGELSAQAVVTLFCIYFKHTHKYNCQVMDA